MQSLLGVVSFLLFALSVFAQSDAGSITGIISSGDRPTVPNALIQAKNTDTGTVYKTASSPTGNYTLSQLPPGRYELSVAALFFNPFQRQDIVVQAGQTSRIDVELGYSRSLGTLGDEHADFAAVLARRGDPPAGPTPRTPDGKPDLSDCGQQYPLTQGTATNRRCSLGPRLLPRNGERTISKTAPVLAVCRVTWNCWAICS